VHRFLARILAEVALERVRRSRRVSLIKVALLGIDRSIESFLAIEIPHFQARAKQGNIYSPCTA